VNQSVKNGKKKFIIFAAIISLGIGLFLSQSIAPGIRVERLTLAKDTPALKFIPSASGQHPVALLCHGITASKETMFRPAEALASAGFVCYAMDFPGHGQSPHRFNVENTIDALSAVSHQIGPIDIFVGHSMGAGPGSFAVHLETLKPNLFIAIRAIPN